MGDTKIRWSSGFSPHSCVENISANRYSKPSEKICSAQNRIIFSNIFRWWKKILTRTPSRELTYPLPRWHMWVPRLKSISIPILQWDKPSARRASWATPQWAQLYWRSCVPILHSPRHWRFTKGVNVFQLRKTRSFIHFQLSNMQDVSNYKPSWQQRKSFRMPPKPLLAKYPNHNTLGLLALSLAFRSEPHQRPEMVRKMLGFKRANPKNTGSFFFVGMGRNAVIQGQLNSRLLIFFSKLPSSGLSGVQRLSSQTSSAKKTVCSQRAFILSNKENIVSFRLLRVWAKINQVSVDWCIMWSGIFNQVKYLAYKMKSSFQSEKKTLNWNICQERFPI